MCCHWKKATEWDVKREAWLMKLQRKCMSACSFKRGQQSQLQVSSWSWAMVKDSFFSTTTQKAESCEANFPSFFPLKLNSPFVHCFLFPLKLSFRRRLMSSRLGINYLEHGSMWVIFIQIILVTLAEAIILRVGQWVFIGPMWEGQTGFCCNLQGWSFNIKQSAFLCVFILIYNMSKCI